MLFDIQKIRNVIPEINDKFKVKIGEEVFELVTEEDPMDDCSDCAFFNYCKDSDHNMTDFTCHGEERPDGLNVKFVWY